MMESLVDDDIDMYIDGHGNPLTRADLKQLISETRQGTT
jgi:anti-sigma factor RsiW